MNNYTRLESFIESSEIRGAALSSSVCGRRRRRSHLRCTLLARQRGNYHFFLSLVCADAHSMFVGILFPQDFSLNFVLLIDDRFESSSKEFENNNPNLSLLLQVTGSNFVISYRRAENLLSFAVISHSFVLFVIKKIQARS